MAKAHASRSWGRRLVSTALVAAAAAAVPGPAAAQTHARTTVDVRAVAAPAPPPTARERAARRRLRRDAVLAVDSRTGTVRTVVGRDEPLTGVAEGDRSAVALGWVRDHRAALGLAAGDVDALVLAERSVSPGTRITHLRYRQADGDIPAFDGGLRVSLDRGGRILAVAGSPRPGLEAPAAAPRLDAGAALQALQRDVGAVRAVAVESGPSGPRRTTRFAGGDVARLVLFGRRLAWHLTYRASAQAHYDAVVDATTGAILFRQNLTVHAAAALVYPSHPEPGAAVAFDLEQAGWLPAQAPNLDGPHAHVRSAGQEVARRGDGTFRYPIMPFGSCAPVICTWAGGSTWQTNRNQNAVQAFYLVNAFRDHLAQAPVSFREFSDGSAVQVETNAPGPLNNASMSTPPSGAPHMQLHRFGGPGFRYVNAGDAAAIVWHEYTHGLSSRLVTYGDGSSALSSAQAAAMGEGWSDWYALDLLESLGGETDLGYYTDATPHTLRSQPIDCAVGSVLAACPGGGYTFGDLGTIDGGPEVHADGEIWAQTLWDLRARLPGRARALITEGMRMSPPEPSFLDMRNAILAAEAGIPGNDRATVWDVFRRRGMGYFAHAEDGDDVTPRQDFSAPPAPGAPQGRTTGTVTSADTGLPLGAVSVVFSGAEATALTGATGAYALDAPAGRYPELAFEAGGYERAAVPDVDVVAGATQVRDVALRRDWAARDGGAVVTTVSDNTAAGSGCGAAQVIDQRHDTVWSAWNPARNQAFPTPAIVVRLPVAIDVSAFGLDPTHGCGNPAGASTAGYRIEVSSDGGAYTTALQGTLTSDRRTLVPATARNVRYVRLTLLSPRTAGSDFIDFSELEVFGGPPNRLPTGTLAASRLRLARGGSVDFAASFTDPDSRITGYDWDFDGNGSVDRTTATPSTSFAYGTAGAFTATVAARDFRGGAGLATRAITVTRPSRPRIVVPKRGAKGRVAVRVTCAVRCRVTATLRVRGKVVQRVRRTVTSQRRIAVKLPRKVRRAARRRDARTVRATLTVVARYADGRRTTEKRTVRIRV